MNRAVNVAWLAALLLVAPSCAKADRYAPSSVAASAPSPAMAASAEAPPVMSRTAADPSGGGQSGKAATIPDAQIARRIIRTAELSLETKTVSDAQKQITKLAETKGGFVVSSDQSSYRGEDGGEQTSVNITLRVPTQNFESTLEALRAIGTRVAREKVTGQDVTEEYLDVEARLRTQRAVEEQYLAILKQAKNIHDTLDVQQKLGEVRGEIERAEGRRRFLENQTNLSTITVYLAHTIDAVEASGPGFGRSIKRAARDSIEVAIGVINFLIRSLGVVIPLFILLVLPLWLVIRLVRRRRQRAQK